MYRWIFDHILVHTDPERAHRAAMRLMAIAPRIPGVLALTRQITRPQPPIIPPHATFLPRALTGRLGVAAGLDKDGEGIEALCAMGFAFVEIGTLTPLPQPGNDRPRLWRLVATRELRNRMGFNNDGVDAAARRLRRLRSTPTGRAAVVGANIGKNKVTPNEEAARDYYRAAARIARWVDFLVINVSSPNTPGLRDLQTVEALTAIIDATRAGAAAATRYDVPIFIKIAPDLDNDTIDSLAELVNERRLAGVVAVNTTIAHNLGDGGVSGSRVLPRGLEVVRRLRDILDDDRTIIGVGGIASAEDAQAYRDAGADLVEALTGFIYNGPRWAADINRAIC